MKYTGLKYLLLFSLYIIPNASYGKLFKNSYVSFQLPPKWKCKLEGTTWTCTSKLNKKAKEAIIILAAKEVGPNDNLTAYMTHLKTKNLSTGVKATHVKTSRVKINNHLWADSLHLSSEVPAYYTRYLGTVKGSIAILVTFSSYRKLYTSYASAFQMAINSLRVHSGELSNKRRMVRNNNTGGQSGNINSTGQDFLGFNDMEMLPEENSTGGGSLVEKIIGLLLLILSAAYYFYYKNKSKRRNKNK